MSDASVVDKIKDITEGIIASMGLDLVELEYVREGRQMVLRLYIDKVGGVNLDDCASVSRELSAVLDVEEFIDDKFTLEVSSPGLNRPLKKNADYEKSIGRLIKIKTFEAIPDVAGNKRKTFLGTLLGFNGNVITMKLQEGQMAEIPLNAVAKANLEFEF
jgi:ribosome maturation factor RimP